MAVIEPTNSDGGGGVYRHSLSGRILLTGGAGFIGRAILKVAKDENWDAKFTILSRDEQKQSLVREKFPDVRLVLGDVCDPHRLDDLMWGHDIVIHAAALKYIPEAEFNVSECIGINLEGSMNVIRAAKGKVDRVVALSTDKAVSPLNVYGATKMLMERLMVEADLMMTDTRYTVVRYGNVIGSTGSFIPMARAAQVDNKTLYLTDPNMTRFWIDYREAVALICEAAQCGDRGVTVIPNPKAATLAEVVEAVEASAGFSAPDLQTKVVGRRPGEKMSESLLNEAESARAIINDGLYYLLPQGRSGNIGEPFELDSNNAERFENSALVSAILDSLNV